MTFEEKYQKLLHFVRRIKHNGCCLVHGVDCISCEALTLLRELGEEK